MSELGRQRDVDVVATLYQEVEMANNNNDLTLILERLAQSINSKKFERNLAKEVVPSQL